MINKRFINWLIVAWLIIYPVSSGQSMSRETETLPINSPSASENVEVVGQVGGWTDDVYVQGGYAYIGEGPRLTILDVTIPSTPKIVGKSPILSGPIGSVFVHNGIAHVADSETGKAWLIDVSNPANPTIISPYPEFGIQAWDIFVVGDLAYLVSNELTVVDISNPAQPVELGSCDTPGTSKGLYVSGNYAYIADYWPSGLRIIDVSDPNDPFEVNYYSTPRPAFGVFVSGTLAYLADETSGIYILDISNPASLDLVGFYPTPGGSFDVVVENNKAYFITAFGMHVLDVSNPADPVEQGGFESRGSNHKMFVNSGIVYTAGGLCLEMVDVSDPQEPVQAGLYATSNWIQDLKVVDNITYLAEDWFGLRLVNTGVPSQPVLYPPNDVEGDYLDVVNPYAYLTSGGMFYVVDISDPENPIQEGSLYVNGEFGVHINGDRAYLKAGYAGLIIVDISNPALPTEIGSYNTAGEVHGVVVRDLIAYVADYMDGLRVIDVSDPANPIEIGFYESILGAENIQLSGNTAYITAGGGGLYLIDITNPANPQEIGQISVDAEDVYVSGDIAYVAGFAGLRVIDVSDPANLHEIGYYNLASMASGVYVSGENAYVAYGALGLMILHYTGEASQTYSIMGQIKDSTGVPMAGVSLSDGSGHSTSTDSSGNYQLSGLTAGTYTLTPSKVGYTYVPANRQIILPPNANGLDFTGWVSGAGSDWLFLPIIIR